jgi:cytochrome c
MLVSEAVAGAIRKGGMDMRARILACGTLAMALLGGSAAWAADMPAGAKQHGCIACHAIDSKMMGPAWKDVSARYRGDEGAREMLIAKVKAGGAGNWNDVTGGIPMPPNSPRVPDDAIAGLVDFILSLE